MDDKSRIAIVNYWDQDDLELEVDDNTTDLDVNKTRYQYGNHLGSASLELDGSGQIITYEEYFPYGGTSFIAGNNQKETGLKEYRYTGKERDDSTGFYYYGARYYAPWTGRWLSTDPAGPVDGLNLYVYCRGNPLIFSDPSGTQTEDEINQTSDQAYDPLRDDYTGSTETAEPSQPGLKTDGTTEDTTLDEAIDEHEKDEIIFQGTADIAERHQKETGQTVDPAAVLEVKKAEIEAQKAEIKAEAAEQYAQWLKGQSFACVTPHPITGCLRGDEAMRKEIEQKVIADRILKILAFDEPKRIDTGNPGALTLAGLTGLVTDDVETLVAAGELGILLDQAATFMASKGYNATYRSDSIVGTDGLPRTTPINTTATQPKTPTMKTIPRTKPPKFPAKSPKIKRKPPMQTHGPGKRQKGKRKKKGR